MDGMEYQDERMVEEFPIPCAQTQTQTQTQTNGNPHSPLLYQPSGSSEAYYAHQSLENYPTLSHNYNQAISTSSDHCPAFDPSSCSSPSSPSLFASTDPFYIAQLQEMQMQIQARARPGYDGQPHNSFARLGKPDEASPFMHITQTQVQVQVPQQYQQRREQAQQSDYRYQWEHMYHRYCPTTAVGS